MAKMDRYESFVLVRYEGRYMWFGPFDRETAMEEAQRWNAEPGFQAKFLPLTEAWKAGFRGPPRP